MSDRSRHTMPFGAELRPDGSVRFRLWAPGQARVSLGIEGAQALPMSSVPGGWHEAVTTLAGAGARYRFVLADGMAVPDPASRFQPHDAHGPSEVIDPGSYPWGDAGWKGRPWSEAVLYELHVGAFTAEGTFRAAIGKLDHLAALGVTAIELMPVADFPGRRGWGYDGVLLYAPDSSYGRPEDLKALVEAAHARGLMVLLDVVYNHFGPEANYLGLYAPQFFTSGHKTQWGDAINYDGPDSGEVREFAIHNALYWLEEFHFDGLRLDAVHAIVDAGAKNVLEELAERVRLQFADRHVHLVLENENNQAGLLHWYTAQWNDDVHHVLHTAATGERSGYYVEYQGDTGKLGRALAEGFAFQGEMMTYRGKARGEPCAHLRPDAFVAFIQNHDQVGNRALGERLGALAGPAAVRAVAAVYLLLPQTPMLFMGEEWNAAEPFPFFCDFEGDLAEAVRRGRRQEFARFPEFQDPQRQKLIPDPLAEATFLSAKLCWECLGDASHAAWLDWYRRILAARRRAIAPALRNMGGNAGRYEAIGQGAVAVHWNLGEQGELQLAANLSGEAVAGFPEPGGRVIWQEGEAGPGGRFGAWSVQWTLAAEGPRRGKRT